MKAGDLVWLTTIRPSSPPERVPARVVLASPNGVSLFLEFDALVHVGGLWHVGCLPVLRDSTGIYRDLVSGEPVVIEPRTNGAHRDA
jgi:hypothetical protein